MPIGGFTATQRRQLVAQFSAQLIDRYGTRALDEARCVIAMLEELGRDELVPVWRGARRRDRPPPETAA